MLAVYEMDKADDTMDEFKVAIDIGGVRFITRRSTLLAVPNTRLYDLIFEDNGAKEFSEFYFDRNSFLFEYILDFYRTGDLHLPQNRCGNAIKSELEFWGLKEADIASCCWKTYTDANNTIETQMRITKEFAVLTQKHKADMRAHTFKEKLWAFLAYPEWSLGAKIYAGVSGFLMILTLTMLLLSTLPEVRQGDKRVIETESESNTTESHRREVLHMMATTTPHDAIMYTDLWVAILFSIEFVARLFSCPDKCAFIRSLSAISDLVYIIPVLFVNIMQQIDKNIWLSVHNTKLIVYGQMIFVLRLLRLYRVACCVRGFKVVILALRASLSELLLLIVLIMSAAVVFAFLIFYIEMSRQDSFYNALVALWWAVITMTSVGYGDVYPVSPFGYVIGVLCALSGILALSLPVPMIANNFNIYYAYKEAPCASVSANRWLGDKQNVPIRKKRSNASDSDHDVCTALNS